MCLHAFQLFSNFPKSVLNQHHELLVYIGRNPFRRDMRELSTAVPEEEDGSLTPHVISLGQQRLNDADGGVWSCRSTERKTKREITKPIKFWEVKMDRFKTSENLTASSLRLYWDALLISSSLTRQWIVSANKDMQLWKVLIEYRTKQQQQKTLNSQIHACKQYIQIIL